MPRPAAELLLPDSLDADAALELLATRLELKVAPRRIVDRHFLDSFDGRLHAEGLRAEVHDGKLSVHEPGAPVRSVAVARRPRHLADELPPGVVRSRLAGVLGPRALLRVVRVRSSVQALAVLDGDAKTVVRLSLERAEAVGSGGRRVGLAPRLSVQAVLGYDGEYERTLDVLRDRLGFEPAPEPLYDAAAGAVGARPEGVASKPKIELAAGTPAHTAAAQVLEQLADIAEAHLPGTIADLDTEFLHHLRTSIRRARSVLRELKGIHDPDARAHLRVELKWAQALTGPVRDLDVQLLEWESLVSPLGRERASELSALRALLERHRASEFARLRRGLRGKRFAVVLRAWRELAAAPPPVAGDAAEGAELAPAPIEAVAGARIRSVYRRMVRDGGRIDDASPAEALHDLRKRGKELRYLLELFGSPFPSEVVKPMIATLKDLQDVLGRFQDRAVQSEALRALADDLAAEPGGPAALLALGPVLDAVLADQNDARRAFGEAFGPFAAGKQRRLVRDTFPKRADP
jgi:CHAD domain-containing protein